MQTEVAELGRIVCVEGSGATARLAWEPPMGEDDEASLTVGHLVGIRRGASLIVATVVRMTTEPAPETSSEPDLIAKLDFMGEVRNHGTNDVFFQRGVSNYPIIGSQVVRLRSEDISVIHRISGSQTVHIGQLRLDDSIPAHVNFQELLCKHFAIVGTTGVGKSSTVALILQQILEQNADLRIFLIDPHNEYGNCFGDKAHVISPRNLSLPFWLFNFEETIDVIFRSRPGVEEEMELLQELIPIAKAQYAAQSRGERIGIRKMDNGGFTADTPVPYRIVDLVSLINDQVGKLENRSVSVKYHRLIGRIETLGNDSRYAFMFNNSYVQDIMTDEAIHPRGAKPRGNQPG